VSIEPHHFQVWSQDASVKVVTMKGVGGKAFCAGGDVVAISKSGSGSLGDQGALARDFFKEEYVADYALGETFS
jgi:3-hydroxyisobutyryl-CoA hydrolase